MNDEKVAEMLVAVKNREPVLLFDTVYEPARPVRTALLLLLSATTLVLSVMLIWVTVEYRALAQDFSKTIDASTQSLVEARGTINRQQELILRMERVIDRIK